MIRIYTTPSCSSCRKAKKWMDAHDIKYREINLFSTKITESDLNYILQNTENGVDDIVSTRSKIFKEKNLNVLDMTMNELKKFIIENPSVLRRPIIVDDDRIQIGYNDDDIRIFIPKRLRQISMCKNCNDEEKLCDYKDSLNKYIQEIKQQLKEERS